MFTPCPSCSRHVRHHDTPCPLCDGAMPVRALPIHGPIHGAPKARVAYLRDISLLQVTAWVAANAPPGELDVEDERPGPLLDVWGMPLPDDAAGLASADSSGDDAFASADATNDPETVVSSPVEEPGRRIVRWLRWDWP